MKSLEQWLAQAERLHGKGMVLGLERVSAVAGVLGLRFDCPVAVVAGTNGKGSTCAMLESIALAAGYRTGLYTSPHLVRFEERCRVGGVPVDAAALVEHFERVERARGEGVLTYFEFTTLAILSLLAAQPLDFVILEVGLGGRLDAVNVVDADCAVITSIDIDHAEWLGNTREAIGFEKAGILRPGRPAVVSDPHPPASIAAHAAELGADLWLLGRDYRFFGQPGHERQQWDWSAAAERGARRYAGLAYPALRGANQLLNASGVLAAFEALRDRLPVNAQAVRSGLAMVELPGRFQVEPGRPAVVLDVAHNPHAMAALAANLDAMGFFPSTHAVFGAMADKDIDAMLLRMDALVDHWHFTDLPTARAASGAELLRRWQAVTRRTGVRADTHADPVSALRAARASADPAGRIVVFGSFFTVGPVLTDLHGPVQVAQEPR